MKERMDWRTGLLVTIWFLVGVLIYTVIKNWGVAGWWDAETWQIVAAIATWLLAGGVAFAILQVREARKSTNAQLAVELFRELRSEETKNILRFIYELRPADVQHLCSADIHGIDSVIDKFELLGALVNQGIIDKRLAVEAFAGPPALRCWYQLAPYIREQENARGFFVANYEVFTRCTVEYFEGEHVEIIFYRIGEKDKHLVEELRKLIKKKDDLRPRSLAEIREDRKRKIKNVNLHRA